MVVDDGAGPRVLRDAAVVARGGKIVEVGRWDSGALAARYVGATVLGGEQSAVLPGLVNAHHHAAGVTNTQHGLPDDVLEPWLLSHAGARSAGPARRGDATLLAAGRLLRTGVTAVVDMAGCGAADEAGQRAMEGQLPAYERAGLRGVVCPGFYFRSRLVHNGDGAFLATLPAGLRARVEAELLPPGWPPAPGAAEDASEAADCDAYLALMERLHAGAAGLRFASLGYGPPGLQWVGARSFHRIAAAAAAHGTIVQVSAMREALHSAC